MTSLTWRVPTLIQFRQLSRVATPRAEIQFPTPSVELWHGPPQSLMRHSLAIYWFNWTLKQMLDKASLQRLTPHWLEIVPFRCWRSVRREILCTRLTRQRVITNWRVTVVHILLVFLGNGRRQHCAQMHAFLERSHVLLSSRWAIQTYRSLLFLSKTSWGEQLVIMAKSVLSQPTRTGNQSCCSSSIDQTGASSMGSKL